MQFDVKYLNPDDLKTAYRVFKEVGVRKERRIHSDLITLAQKYLRLTGLDFPSEFACELWIETFGAQYDECRLVILEHLIEPIAPAVPVKVLFENEKISEEEIDLMTLGFLVSPLFKKMAETDSKQAQSTENSQSTESVTEQPEKTEQV